MGIIYEAKNTVDGTLYIGKTIKTLRVRATQHCTDAKSNRYNTHFHRAIRKYGCKAFEWRILAELDDSVLSAAEIDYIELARDQGFNVYNMTDGGEGVTSSVGYKHSEEQKRLIGNASRNRKNTWTSKALAKTYVLRSPEGQLVEIHNLTQWCKDMGFDRGYITRLLNGTYTSAYGWTLP